MSVQAAHHMSSDQLGPSPNNPRREGEGRRKEGRGGGEEEGRRGGGGEEGRKEGRGGR